MIYFKNAINHVVLIRINVYNWLYTCTYSVSAVIRPIQLTWKQKLQY